MAPTDCQMAKRTKVAVKTAKSRQRVLHPRRGRRVSRCRKIETRPVDPLQSPAKAHLGRDQGSKRPRRRSTVADAAFVIFRETASNLWPRLLPPGFELRLRRYRGEQISGSIWHLPPDASSGLENGEFVSGWFHVLATTDRQWLIAYMPPSCDRFEAELVPFNEVHRFPAVLRKFGCRVGSARLLVEMMSKLIPQYPS
jgi:hypothetical protein